MSQQRVSKQYSKKNNNEISGHELIRFLRVTNRVLIGEKHSNLVFQHGGSCTPAASSTLLTNVHQANPSGRNGTQTNFPRNKKLWRRTSFRLFMRHKQQENTSNITT